MAAIGLGPADEAAYELLVDHPSSTLAELGAAWLRPEPLRAILDNLIAKGLVHLLPETPARYLAAAPEVALDALLPGAEQRLRRARRHIDRLVAAYQESRVTGEPGSVVEVVTGQLAVRRRLARLHRGVQREVRCLESTVHPGRPDTAGFFPAPPAAGVCRRTVYDRAAVSRLDALHRIEELVRAGLCARVLPELPIRLCLLDESVGFMPLPDRPGAEADADAVLIVHPCLLLDALGDLFEGLWQRALPVQAGVQAALREASTWNAPAGVRDQRVDWVPRDPPA